MPPDSLESGLQPDAGSTAVERLSGQEAVDLLVAGLPADMAEVLLLRVVADLPVAEVAQLMGRSAGSVRVLQHRALKRAAELLGERERPRRQV
jgi:RNA polymerase sigma-70 factor, ECF subfamily